MGSATGAALLDRVLATRARTEALAARLGVEDQQAQSMADASPTKWHLAHTTWFFDVLVLARAVPGYVSPRPSWGTLFNSYYEAVGPRHARPKRGLLTRPTLEDVLAYRKAIDGRLTEHIDALDAFALELGLHHEQQHQELILTDAKHLLSENPLAPAYAESTARRPDASSPLTFATFDKGVFLVGASDEGFAFDNERPRHEVLVPSFALGSRLVTCGEYLAFMEAGGYAEPAWWLSDGFATKANEGWTAPLYWRKKDGAWFLFTLHGERALDLDEPVTHVSFYEADAYARFRGARLATEAEWEVAAGSASDADANFVETDLLHPRASRGHSAIAQLYGDAWEWTQSAYTPYPGFVPFDGAFAEYNGKFMCNQLVLRGGSALTPAGHVRASYRNFFPPTARWQMTGIRLARWT